MILVLWAASLVISMLVGYCWRAYWDARLNEYDRLVRALHRVMPQTAEEMMRQAQLRERWLSSQVDER